MCIRDSIRAAQHFAKYRGTTFQDGRTENEDRTFGKRKSAMADIGTEAEQRKQFITCLLYTSRCV